MKALLIGATGLIGRALLDQLLEDDRFSVVHVFTRRSTGKKHHKLKETLVDFDQILDANLNFEGDVLFSTLGTTIKSAGSQKRQREIDFDMQYNTAKLAAEAGVQQLVLLSSAGANAKSSVFYTRIKGELDEAVQLLDFERVAIIRPSMLAGNRSEFRWKEKLFTPLMYAFSWVPGIRKYRPIKDFIVARAMINAVFESETRTAIYELENVFQLARREQAK